MCPACKRLRNDLNQRLKKVKSINLQQKENRVQPSSHFPEKYLSPKSLKRSDRTCSSNDQSCLRSTHTWKLALVKISTYTLVIMILSFIFATFIHLYFIIATGSRRNSWSMVTIRLALAVYTRSPASYEALKSFGLIQLLSRATLQAYTGASCDEAG